MIPTPPPFFLFTTHRLKDPQVYQVLERYFDSRDYLSAELARTDLALAQKVDPTHHFELCDSLADLNDNVMVATTLFYDLDHWKSTPTAEQMSPAGSIAAAARAAHAEPDRKFGIAADGAFIGVTRGACTASFRAGILPTLDWSQIDFVNLQVQRILSDSCADTLSVKDYVAFVTEAARFIRAKNPHTLITAQLSFRFTPPEKIIAAIHALTGTVDGFYLAYPNKPQLRTRYCTAANLQKVLASLRPDH